VDTAEPQSLRLLRLEHAVARILTDVNRGREAFTDLVPVVGGMLGWSCAVFWVPSRSGRLWPGLTWTGEDGGRETWVEAMHPLRAAPGEGLAGRVFVDERADYVADIASVDSDRARVALAEGLVSSLAFPLLSRDGAVGVVEAFYDHRTEPDQDLLDTLTGIGHQVGQVVVRARADRALRMSEARMRGVLEGALDAIVTVNGEGRITGFNPAAERMFGISGDAARGREAAGLLAAPGEIEVARAKFQDGSFIGRRTELRGRRADGTEFPAELSFARLGTSDAYGAHIRDITERLALIDELRASRARVVEAADAERRRVERDLHDGAQQRLLAVAMDLRLAAEQVQAGDPCARDTLKEAAEELDRATKELRELARGLHPAILTDRGLGVAIAGLVRRAPLPVTVRVDLDERPPAAIEAAAYFVVAEALTNIARYANAAAASVEIERTDGAVLVTVSDDGDGGASLDGGSGLRGLSDRLAVLDGTLQVLSPPGQGTWVHARVPLERS
jgi:PAS domain S-box-containing protein